MKKRYLALTGKNDWDVFVSQSGPGPSLNPLTLANQWWDSTVGRGGTIDDFWAMFTKGFTPTGTTPVPPPGKLAFADFVEEMKKRYLAVTGKNDWNAIGGDYAQKGPLALANQWWDATVGKGGSIDDFWKSWERFYGLPKGDRYGLGPIQPGPVILPGWNLDINEYLPKFQSYLESQKNAWQQGYRNLGNTTTSWYDWVQGQYGAGIVDWVAKNWTMPPLPGPGEPDVWSPAVRAQWKAGKMALYAAWQDWLKKNSVDYTNPMRVPIRNRMQIPIADWPRLAGPEWGIPRGFAERATKSPWSAPYRGGAFGPTARKPAWTAGLPPRPPDTIPNPW